MNVPSSLFFKIFFLWVVVGVFIPEPRDVRAADLPIAENVNRQLVLDQLKKSGELIAGGEDLLKQKKVIEAMGMFRKAKAIAPYDYRPYAFLAGVYFTQGLFDDGLKILEETGRYNLLIDDLYQFLKPAFALMPPSAYFSSPSEKVWIAPFKDNKDCAVSISFDDGAQSDYSLALPLLDKAGWKATFFLNPSVIEDTPQNIWWGSWDEWRDARRRGHEIANHGHRHRGLIELDEETLEHEINGAYDLITEKIGEPPVSFAFPHDLVGPMGLLKVQERHLAIRDHVMLNEIYDRVFIPIYGGKYFSLSTANYLIDLAMEKHFWFIPECHAIQEKEIRSFKPLTVEFLEQHLSYIKSHEDKIWVDTFFNVFRYLHLRRGTTLHVLEQGDHELILTMAPSVTDPRYLVPLTLVIDVSPDAPGQAWAAVEGREAPVPVQVAGGRLFLSTEPSPRAIHVRWE